jgi:hypothetical protein
MHWTHFTTRYDFPAMQEKAIWASGDRCQAVNEVSCFIKNEKPHALPNIYVNPNTI